MCLLLSKGSKQAMKKLAIVNASYVYLSCQILVMIFHVLDTHLMSCCYMQRHSVILDWFFWRHRVGEDGTFSSMQDCSSSDMVGFVLFVYFALFYFVLSSWDAEGLPELTGLLRK